MDPVTLIVVPGFLGGIVLALFVIRLRQRDHTGEIPADAYRVQPLSTDVINMARIQVAGIGGLGLVAMAVCVALFVPRIRQSIALALVLGVVFALGLILRRRAEGPMPSSGRRPGANTTLSIDEPAGEVQPSANGKHRQDLEATPGLA
jgi:hypothetical protein